jgi:large subunit ribosomal protein L25
MILFRELVYTSEAHFVNLDIEGTEYWSILQDIQFHPVSEIILHADFLELHEGRPVRMDIPVVLEGQSKGVTKGGTLVHKRRKLSIMAKPKNMPEQISIDVTDLDFHSAIKVRDLETENYTIQDPPQASIANVEIPRALRGKTQDELDEETAGTGEGESVEA